MAFMQKQAERFKAWQVETSIGGECVPFELVGNDLTAIGQYCEGKPRESDDSIDAELVEGWFCRLSAPGYMDCTEWHGPYETEQEAMEALNGMYGDDEDEACHD